MTNTKYIEVAAAVTKEIRTPWGNVQMPISQLKTDSQIKCLILCLISKATTKKQAAEEVSALYDVQGTQRKSDKFKLKYLENTYLWKSVPWYCESQYTCYDRRWHSSTHFWFVKIGSEIQYLWCIIGNSNSLYFIEIPCTYILMMWCAPSINQEFGYHLMLELSKFFIKGCSFFIIWHSFK